jgi:spore germination protein GerM
VIRAIAVIAVLVGLTACGVSTDSEPHEISQANVPEGDTSSRASSAGQGGEVIDVWFLQGENDDVHLVARERTVRRPKTARGVLEALLLDGPNETERAFDITTAIPSSTTLAGPPELGEGGVLVVDLSDGLFEVRGDELRNAYAQLVCTATELDTVQSVAFELDGETISAFDGNGRSTSRPLRCQDYAGLQDRSDGSSSSGSSSGSRSRRSTSP